MNDFHTSAAATVTSSGGRDRVLREAHALFLERGFAEVSMQQIADAAGMTKAALYYHFRNKEDLFVEVLRHEGDCTIEDVQALMEGCETLREQLTQVALFSLKSWRSDVARLIHDFQRHVSKERQQQLRREAGGLNMVMMLRPYFDRAKATGELRDIDTEVAAAMFSTIIRGRYKFTEHKHAIEPNEEFAETLVDLFLHGVSANRS